MPAETKLRCWCAAFRIRFLPHLLPFVSKYRVVLNYLDYLRLKKQVADARKTGISLPPLLEKTCLHGETKD